MWAPEDDSAGRANLSGRDVRESVVIGGLIEMSRFLRYALVAGASCVYCVANPAGAAAQQAFAAPKTPHSWTGFYVGGNVGYGQQSGSAQFWGDVPGGNGAGTMTLNAIYTGVANPNVDASPFSERLGSNGALGGLQAGYSWQWNPTGVIVGVEADIQWTAMGSSLTRTNPAGNVAAGQLALRAEDHLRWFGTLRGRAGFLATPNLLLYATGGLAFGEDRASASVTNRGPGPFAPNGSTTLLCQDPNTCLAGSGSRGNVGWAAGAGGEWALTHNWSVKLEYLHIDLGRQDVLMPVAAPSTGTGFLQMRVRNAYDIGRFGLNYHF